MSTTTERITEIKNNGYDLDFSTVFNESFENYKKIALNAGIATILFMFVLAIVVCIPLFIFIGISSLPETMKNMQPENMSPAFLFSYIVTLVIFAGLMAPFTAGILKMAYNAAHNQEVAIGNAFEYFTSSYFGQLFIAMALITIVSSLFSVGLAAVGYNFLGIILSSLVSFLTLLTIPLIIFGNVKAVEAIQGSMIAVSKQPLIIVGLLIVSVLFAFLGILGFCIGIFFTMPIIYSLYYILYRTIFEVKTAIEMPETF